MALTLKLIADPAGRLVADLGGQVLAVTSPDALPGLPALQADPYSEGRKLFAALGGSMLLRALETDRDALLLLDLDEAALAVPWEFAAFSSTQLLAAQFGLLRVVDRPTSPAPEAGPFNFFALAADPLVDKQGRPREGYRLDVHTEMRAIRRALAESGAAVRARRLPPTVAALRQALNRARSVSVLHITCHGDVIATEAGPQAILILEDADGRESRLPGADLLGLGAPGLLRLGVFSACHTADGVTANLARSLALAGLPFAVGMQGAFPDPLSDELAAALYETALAGHSLAHALRQARQALLHLPRAVGLPVGYCTREGWRPLPLAEGAPQVDALGLPGRLSLPQEVQPPRPLLGRDGELHELAKTYSSGVKVVTVAGAGGMGKTALSAAFAERFAWRWPEGVRGLSFANDVVDARAFRRDLLRLFCGEVEAAQLADSAAGLQTQRILEAAREWDGLLLLDNYESVLQRLALAADGDERAAQERAEAEAVHRLVYQLAEGGLRLLLTSRDQPAQLPGERLFPEADSLLPGLLPSAGAALFLLHSARAKEEVRAEHARLATNLSNATGGHPLAIALLAGEYDTSRDVPPEKFLENWESELASARRPGLAPHQVTFAAAFARSYNRLSAADQARLRALSVFAFPFFAEAAALVWGAAPLADWEEIPEANLAGARAALQALKNRSLLEVDATFAQDNTPATYRFQPAVRQEVARRLTADERRALQAGYAAYGAWLARRGYGHIHRDPGLNRLVRASFEALEAAAADGVLPAPQWLWHMWWLAWLRQAFGEIGAAKELLERAWPPDKPLPDPQAEPEAARAVSRLRNELAGVYRVRGDLDGALRLYDESLRLDEQLGDLRGKSATLHAKAYILQVRGDLDGALRLYDESLRLQEQLGDLRGKSATLHAKAYILQVRGDLDGALRLYDESLRLDEQLGDLRGKSATLHAKAYILQVRGDLDGALRLYDESLRLKEQLGDLRGKSATLSGIADVRMAQENWDEAERLLRESLAISQAIGEPPAFALVKLGQVAQARGNHDAALRYFQQGLEIFERLGMPRESGQVRELIAQLQGGPAFAPAFTEAPTLQALTAQARAAAQRGDAAAAVAAQSQAVALLRQALAAIPQTDKDTERRGLITLSIQLYNLAGYYAQNNQYAEAVRALEEVVALDERTGHEDLDSDRQTLEHMRRLAALTPEQRAQAQASRPAAQTPPDPAAFIRQLESQLAQAPPELRAGLQALLNDLRGKSLEEQAAFLHGLAVQARRAQIEQWAEGAEEIARAVWRGAASRADVVADVERMAAQAADGEDEGSPWLELAAYLCAVVALLKGEAAPPVPAAYAARLAALQSGQHPSNPEP
jgi:tetratricopeptide (TPR) repeat protein